MGLEIGIYSYELEAEVPVALIGGIIIGRRWGIPDIRDHIHQIVGAYHIDVLVPFLDSAILIAGAYVATYADVWSPVVRPGLAETLSTKCFQPVPSRAQVRTYGQHIGRQAELL